MYTVIGFDLTRPYLPGLSTFQWLIDNTINNNPEVDVTAPDAGVTLCALAAQATDCLTMKKLCEAIVNHEMKLFIGDEGRDGTLMAIECVTFGGNDFNKHGLERAIECIDEWSEWFKTHFPETDLHRHLTLFPVFTNWE